MINQDRLNEFIWYHLNGDAAANSLVLNQYANENHLSGQDRLDLCYLYSLVYNVSTAIYLLRERDEIRCNPEEYAARTKSRLMFQTDRRYVRCNGMFEKCLTYWNNHLSNSFKEIHLKFTVGKKALDIFQTLNTVETWPSFGRYAAFLFAETYEALLNLEPCNVVGCIDYETGRVFSAGLVNISGYDEMANRVEHDKTLPVSTSSLDEIFTEVVRAVQLAGGTPSVFAIETSLCAYRKFFKGTRYNGYYADRQLEEMLKLSQVIPSAVQEIADCRLKVLNMAYLGEVKGWSGIRKDLYHYYLNHRRIYGCPI